MDITSQKISSPKLPSPPSKQEAKLYYAGLPSCPILVARSSTTEWEPPANPGENPLVLRDLHPFQTCGNDPFCKAWQDDLARKVVGVLAEAKVDWTSVDVVRIGNKDEYNPPVVVWIGVTPRSLSGADGVVVVSRCKELLEDYDLADIEVEIRESVFGSSG